MPRSPYLRFGRANAQLGTVQMFDKAEMLCRASAINLLNAGADAFAGPGLSPSPGSVNTPAPDFEIGRVSVASSASSPTSSRQHRGATLAAEISASQSAQVSVPPKELSRVHHMRSRSIVN
jgi:hypothetical protein